jgi:hypothetical protein
MHGVPLIKLTMVLCSILGSLQDDIKKLTNFTEMYIETSLQYKSE